MGLALFALSLARPAPAGSQAETSGTGGASLQEWIARLRREREATRASVESRVHALARDLEALASEDSAVKVEATRAALTALGPEAIPLLAPELEPGADASPAARFRARQIARVLAAARPTSITAELVAHVRAGTADARANALAVLAAHGDPPRALTALAELYEAAQGAARGEILAAIASLGGPEADGFLGSALGDAESEVVATALDALTRARNERLAAPLLEFVRCPRAPAHVDRLLAYYVAVPAAMTQEHALALVELSRHVALAEKTKARVLETLVRFPLELDAPLERELEAIAGAGSRDVRESALVLLAVLGDRNARKSLLRPYEDTIKKSPKWAQAYAQLGDVLARIRDHKKAIGEYKTALELMSREGRVESAPFLGIARCNAILGDFKEAAEYLEKAPVSARTLRELADDPDFAAMAASPRYAKVFHLDGER